MRLWSINLLPYLPKSQILAQWRELNSIYKKQDKHILINYIYDYPKDYLYSYSMAVIIEMQNRHYKIKSFDNFKQYFLGVNIDKHLRFKEHDKDYLTICYYNLLEKCMRGQKDFTLDLWLKLDDFYKKEMSK